MNAVTGNVQLLDDALIDQIAAGEVVERPASVVKELLDNAVDAGARTITVEVSGSGLELLRVTDDGSGMSRTNATLAVRRHATSKLRHIDDLLKLSTLGFRGEALPSIAAVSRFSLRTRSRDDVVGTRVDIEDNDSPRVVDAGCAVGTTVEAKDLFYNVPARKKFLKSAPTEAAQIAEVCQRMAMTDPGLRLVLQRHGGRSRTYLPVSTLGERVAAALGTAELVHIHSERNDIQVEALLAPPERSRSGAGGLHIFVNGRPVRDRGLARAVAFSYGSVLPPGRYPVGAVYLTLPPTEVDANVHPQKTEVRFAHARHVFDTVARAIAGYLGAAAFGRPGSATPWRGGAAEARPGGAGSAAMSDAAKSAAAGLLAPARTEGASKADDPWGLGAAMFGARETARAYDRTVPDGSRDPARAIGGWRVLGQVRAMLIVCEGDDALVVLDQHAADERIRFARLQAAYRTRKVATQRLLFPERVEVSEGEALLVEERQQDILATGLDCARVGPSTIAVHAVPSLLSRAEPARLLRDLLDELDHRGDRSFGDALDTALATMACHGAIRAGDPLSLEECAALLAGLDEVRDFAGHCPHGRPVAYSVPFAEIQRRLGR